MNKVILIGNLTKDPELTETSNGISVCRFSIAVRRNYQNADGEYESDFFNCQAWRGTAEAISRYAHKGNKVAVSGSLQNRRYEDRNGDKRTATEIQVQDVEFLTPKQSDDYDEVGHDIPRGQTRQTERRTKQLVAFDDDSDIPF